MSCVCRFIQWKIGVVMWRHTHAYVHAPCRIAPHKRATVVVVTTSVAVVTSLNNDLNMNSSANLKAYIHVISEPLWIFFAIPLLNGDLLQSTSDRLIATFVEIDGGMPESHNNMRHWQKMQLDLHIYLNPTLTALLCRSCFDLVTQIVH